MFYDILQLKNAFLDYKNKKFKMSKNWDFSKWISQWFWSKICHFSILFFFLNIAQDNVFYDILERKSAFPDNKNKKLKKSNNWDFSKGVSQWFWTKSGHFSMFFLGYIKQENIFCFLLGGKNAFLDYKNNKFKTSKNWDLGSKIGHISILFFKEI